jgi:hypothetical protein
MTQYKFYLSSRWLNYQTGFTYSSRFSRWIKVANGASESVLSSSIPSLLLGLPDLNTKCYHVIFHSFTSTRGYESIRVNLLEDKDFPASPSGVLVAELLSSGDSLSEAFNSAVNNLEARFSILSLHDA